jgi:hypothetical protein
MFSKGKAHHRPHDFGKRAANCDSIVDCFSLTKLSWANNIWSQDPEKPGPLERTKAQVCENIALYAKKYNEEEVEFAKHLPMFVQDIWGLLVTTSDERCNDYVRVVTVAAAVAV